MYRIAFNIERKGSHIPERDWH